jgi:tRNA 2-thiouridine synthesizing protein A
MVYSPIFTLLLRKVPLAQHQTQCHTRVPGETLVEDTNILDLRGLNCPLPVMKTRKHLKRMAKGEQLVVKATDPMSAIDIPHMCQQDGHVLIENKMVGDVRQFKIEC